MTLNWNEIRQRATRFALKWADATDERAEAQSFWNDFFEVFGKKRKHVGSFEQRVKTLKGTPGFIDLFWPGKLIAESKSSGKSLEKAAEQAREYNDALMNSGREDQCAEYILVCDFQTLILHDLIDGQAHTIPVAKLHDHVHLFDFIAGHERRKIDPEDPANIRAAEKLAGLLDALKDGGYPEHDLERFMVRILFCLFAEDTAIFEQPSAFQFWIEDTTKEDGSDLGPALSQWFEILNTPEDRRQTSLDDRLAELPYVNGELYHGRLPFANFTSTMRTRLLDCCKFKWSEISPAVFGSLFQSIMAPAERRQIGAHYTSERDILKLINSLFMDDLRERLEKAGKSKAKLRALHEHIGTITILDPACGCGNFLVIAYRELRRLELDILRALHPRVKGASTAEQRVLDVRAELRIDVDLFYGIEIEEWPARIAEVAMWLMDHQMNLEVTEVFGEPVVRLPLEKSAHITCANALRIDWNEVLPAEECSFVLGNPPFIGKKERDTEQRVDMTAVWGNLKGAGNLDYVTCWYRTACRYIDGRPIGCAFVSTNSICQGEQVGTLWPEMFRLGCHIIFGHRTFPWQSEARGRAHVHVVIVGFRCVLPASTGRIYDYDSRGNPAGTADVASISPYLTAGSPAAVTMRTKPINNGPIMRYGSMMIDKDRKQGNEAGLVFGDAERDVILNESQGFRPFIRPIYGGDEYINGERRWCLWLADAPPGVLRTSADVQRRLQGIRAFRQSSSRTRTVELAKTPALFGEIRQPRDRYLLIPKVSSERRDYIPIGFVEPEIIASGSALIIPNATEYEFGVLHSAMHMAWTRHTCGRLESRYQYSARLVYNNFPWPEAVTDKQRQAVETAAQGVLDARTSHPDSTLADLYDPLSMPPDLAKAHTALDRAVDRCYRPQPFPDERRRFEHLFAMWERLTTPLTAPAKPKRRRRKSAP